MSHLGNAAARARPDVPALAGDAPYPRRWLMLPVALSAMFMSQFDLFVVNIAAPSLQHDIQAGPAALELIVAGYAFTYASGLVTSGRLGDLIGARKMLLVGMLAFTVASLLCGLAQSPGQLVVARLLQGLTGAVMVPQVLALITAVFPPPERPRALGWFGVTIGVGAVAGQVLGGALLEGDVFGLGWRVIFLVNVPIGLVAVLLALRVLPHRTGTGRAKLDPLGAIGVSVSLALALIPLVFGRSEGWPVWVWVCLACSVPLMALTVLWEQALTRRGGQPVLELSLFHNKVIVRGLVVCIILFISFFGSMFVLTLVLQAGLGLSPLQAGIAFTPLGLAFAAASFASNRLAARHGSARLVTIGSAISYTGMWALLMVTGFSGEHTSTLRIIGPLVVMGFGNGLAVPAITGSVLAGVPTQHAGAAAGILITSQQFASAAGVTVLGTVFFTALGSRFGVEDYASVLSWVAAIDLVLILVACGTSLLLPRPAQAAAGAPPAAAGPAAAAPVAEVTPAADRAASTLPTS